MAKAKRRNSPAETNGDSGFVIQPDVNAVVVRVPVKFYRRNGRQMVLAKEDASGTNHQAAPAPNNALAANLAKAWMWQELGRANGVDRTYVSRILRLTSLSPDIVKQILVGDEPSSLTLRSLLKGVAPVWKHQEYDFWTGTEN